MRSPLWVPPTLVAGLMTALVPSARSASVPPGTAMHTLTLIGTNLTGGPDSGGQVQVDSVGNAPLT